MKLTTEIIKKLIKEELQNILEYKSLEDKDLPRGGLNDPNEDWFAGLNVYSISDLDRLIKKQKRQAIGVWLGRVRDKIRRGELKLPKKRSFASSPKNQRRRRPVASKEEIKLAEKKIARIEKHILPYLLKNLDRLKIEFTAQEIESKVKELKANLFDEPQEVDKFYSDIQKAIGNQEFRKAVGYQSFSDKHFPTFKKLGKAIGLEE